MHPVTARPSNPFLLRLYLTAQLANAPAGDSDDGGKERSTEKAKGPEQATVPLRQVDVYLSAVRAWAASGSQVLLPPVLEALVGDHGSLEDYLEQAMGVGPAELAELRRRYLE